MGCEVGNGLVIPVKVGETFNGNPEPSPAIGGEGVETRRRAPSLKDRAKG